MKFMKLMGVKNVNIAFIKRNNVFVLQVEQANLNDVKLLPGLKYLKGDMKEFNAKTDQMNQDLEYQFDSGVNRRFAGKRGLGAW